VGGNGFIGQNRSGLLSNRQLSCGLEEVDCNIFGNQVVMGRAMKNISATHSSLGQEIF
jgi:hypothetical protein